MRGPLAAWVLVAALLAGSRPAGAWDPGADEWLDPEPAFDPLPAFDAAPAPAPAPFVVPDGLYLVTDIYAGDIVTTSGATTTYATATTQQTPGTYARVIDTVGTGATSQFDGAAFNGRAALADGRAVAGTYYQDFVLTAEGFVAVNVVFFQDDSITTAAAAPQPAPPSATTPAPVTAPLPLPAAPVVDPRSTPGAAAPLSPATPDRAAPAAAGDPSAGVALAPGGPVLGSIEVLRGRRVALWPRLFIDGASVPVRGWRLVAGRVDVVSARDGTGATPCEAAWLTLPRAGASWTLRFEITSDALPGRVRTATLEVLVRSPALEQ